MKNIFALLICCSFLLQQAQGRNWYVANSGNDANSNAIGTPWQTIDKINASWASIAAGDSILFKAGDIFFGSLVIGKASVKIGRYGTGAKPIITGSITLSSWTLTTPGIYKTSAVLLNNTNLVSINGNPAQIARYPNPTDADGGYITFKTGTIGYIVDTSKNKIAVSIGDYISIKTNDFHFDNGIITRLSGDTFFYRTGIIINASIAAVFSVDVQDGHGYFWYNKKSYLDQQNEYWYDSTAKELYVYFGATNPATQTVKAAAKEVLIDCNGYQNISIENIALENAGLIGIKSHNGNGLIIKNVDCTNSGGAGFLVSNTPNTTIDNCKIYNSLSCGINLNNRNSTTATISNCSVRKSGYIPGMGSYYDPADYCGIYANCANLTVRNNRIDSAGYNGISWQGTNALITRNVINTYGFVLQDCGGLYTYTRATKRYYNRVVSYNIVKNGIGNNFGSPITYLKTKNYYSDGESSGTIYEYNISDSSNGSGFHCNNCDSLIVRYNLFSNSNKAFSLMKWDYSGVNVRGNIFKKNILYERSPAYNDYNMHFTISRMYGSLLSNCAAVGIVDSNYLNYENEIPFGFELYDSLKNPINNPPYNFEAYKAATGWDANSKLIRSYKKYNLLSTIGSNRVSNATFTSAMGWTLSGSSTTFSVASNTATIKFNSPAVRNYSLLYQNIGAIDNANKYLVRVKTTGTTDRGVLQVFFRLSTSPYTALTPIQYRAFNTTPEIHEFLFTSPVTNSSAQLVIGINQNSGTTGISNVEMYEANATINNISDSVKIIINDADTVQTYNLGARYITVDDSIYQTVSVAPRGYFFGTYYGPVIGSLTPINVAESKTNVLCNGNATGTATVTMTGGKTPYSILWNNGATSFALTNLTAGTYTYTAKDSVNQTKTGSITITQPAAALSATATAGPVLGNNATVTVTASGGTPNTGTPAYNGIGTFTGTVGNNFYIVSDANGCQVQTSVNIVAAPVVTPVITTLKGPWIFKN